MSKKWKKKRQIEAYIIQSQNTCTIEKCDHIKNIEKKILLFQQIMRCNWDFLGGCGCLIQRRGHVAYIV